MHPAVPWILAVIVLIFHYWACRRPPKYWYVGGIVPGIWAVLLAVLFYNGKVHPLQDWRVLLFPTLILLLMWLQGHEAAKKKEMEQMKSKDL